MQQKRVLILGDGKLLSVGVTKLLQKQPNIEVVTIEAGDPKALGKIRDSKADVVVVPSYDPAACPVEIGRILSEIPGAKVVVISLGSERTEMNVYKSERVVEASLEELIAAIEQADQQGVMCYEVRAKKVHNGGDS